MQARSTLIAIFALSFAFCVSGHAQDSPSLGDLARQAQKDKDKDKANKPAAKIITNDDVPSGSRGGSSAAAGGPGRVVQTGSEGNAAEVSSPAEGLEKLQSILDQLDALDRTTLARNVLEGNDANFPGRAQWEQKLFTAKQSFVSQGRALLVKARQLEASAEGMKDVQDPNDPRAKNMTSKLQQLVQDNERNSAGFQAVIAEGRDLAGQPAAH